MHVESDATVETPAERIERLADSFELKFEAMESRPTHNEGLLFVGALRVARVEHEYIESGLSEPEFIDYYLAERERAIGLEHRERKMAELRGSEVSRAKRQELYDQAQTEGEDRGNDVGAGQLARWRWLHREGNYERLAIAVGEDALEEVGLMATRS